MTEAIACKAVFYKATTTADGCWRITFDLSENDSGRVADLTNLRGQFLFLTVIPEGCIPEDTA